MYLRSSVEFIHEHAETPVVDGPVVALVEDHLTANERTRRHKHKQERQIGRGGTEFDRTPRWPMEKRKFRIVVDMNDGNLKRQARNHRNMKVANYVNQIVKVQLKTTERTRCIFYEVKQK